ncbi:hypothetical protein [Microbacterium sp.]|uniref:hypothetical protein n=1 Tax=Microbacterium sp. TaxID=51671 RepID=UPI0028AC67D6|nr:hypothetical protein [Microbacterium sp.]
MPTHAPSVAGVAPADVAAWIALALSVIGLLVSVVLRYLDGPRARIRLRAVLFDVSFGPTTTYNKGAWPIPTNDGDRPRSVPAFGDVVEVAEIVLENVGRHPMTVYDVGFSWKGARPKWWMPRVKHSATPRPLLPQQADEEKFSAGDRFRIEPADMVHLLVDYWGIVQRSRPNRHGVIKLRAHAQVAGRRRPRRSSLRLRWAIRDDTNTAIGGAARIPARAVIARSVTLSILWTSEHTPMNVSYLARELEAHIGGKWPTEWAQQYQLVRSFFDEHGDTHLALYDDPDGRIMTSTLPFGLVRELEEWKSAIDWADIRSESKTPREEAPAEPAEQRSTSGSRRAQRAAGPPNGAAIAAGPHESHATRR